jgi:hypothetical protein
MARARAHTLTHTHTQEYFAGFVGGDGTGDVREGWGYQKCRALLIVGPSGGTP